MRVDRRFPALSSFLGHRLAHEIRCAAVGNRPMSVPISAAIICALSSLIPGMVVSSSVAVRNGSMRAFTSRSMSLTTTSKLGFGQFALRLGERILQGKGIRLEFLHGPG